jgi:hypothetical protein
MFRSRCAVPTRKNRHTRVGLLMLCFFAGCSFDPDNRCSPGQLFNDEINVCYCPSGTVNVEGGCKACGANEKVSNQQCVCANGSLRVASGVCTISAPGLAEPCVPGQSAICSNPAYPVCTASPAGGGYCTSSGCTTDVNCPSGFTCATWATPSYCMRPATGLGKACVAQNDCASQEASYCETQVAKACLVSGCDLAINNCQTGFVCCDVSSYGIATNLCAPIGLCP